jgi:tetratricopeptide (TPR) repeat protein
MYKKIFSVIFIGCFVVFTTAKASESIQQTAQKILAKLYAAHGDKTYSMPVLSVINTVNAGASFRRRSNKIVLEEKAYTVCRSFGKDSLQALAFLLGHELAHAFQEVGGSNFLSGYKHEHTDQLEEQDADIFGVFVSYQAGFKNYKILPQIIEKIYSAYDLMGKTLPGYPSFSDRKATCEEVLKITEELVHLFDAANYLSVIGKYHLAAACYERIEQCYKGIEIYNNIGVNYALEALGFTPENTLPFIYPLELDINTRLRKQQIDLGGKGLTPEQKRQRAAYLNKAAQFFIKATKMDPDYLAADMNLLCILNLKEEYKKVIEYYQKSLAGNKVLQGNTSREIKAKIKINLAIALSGVGQKEEATRILKSIQKKSLNRNIGFLAAYNLNVLKGIKNTKVNNKSGCDLPLSLVNIVDEVRLHRPIFDNKITLSATDDLLVSILKKEHSMVYFFEEKGLPSFSMQQVFKSFTVPLNRVANTGAETISTSAGYFRVCTEEKLIFQIDEQKQEGREWLKYYDFKKDKG